MNMVPLVNSWGNLAWLCDGVWVCGNEYTLVVKGGGFGEGSCDFL